MKPISTLLLALALCNASFATASKAMPTSASPAVAALPTSPWSPLISFIGTLWSLFKGSNQDKKTAQQNLPKTVQEMDQTSKMLEALPDLLEDSRRLRQNAIELAQLVDLARHDENLANQNWSDVTSQINLVKKQYDSIYGNAKSAYVPILQHSASYHDVTQGSGDAWDAIDKLMAKENKTPASRKDTLEALNSRTNALVKAGLLPEWWATDESRYLITQYKTWTATAQAKTGKGSANPSSADMDYRSKPHVELTGWLQGDKRLENQIVAIVQEVPNPERQTSSARLEEEVNSYRKAPDWMTTTVNQTRSEYRAGWLGTLTSGLVGAAVGFVLLLFLPAVTRSLFPPAQKAQVDLLTRSLAFRADEEEQFAKEIGALNLDVLAYVVGDANFLVGMRSRGRLGIVEGKIENPVFTRIQELRGKIRE